MVRGVSIFYLFVFLSLGACAKDDPQNYQASIRSNNQAPSSQGKVDKTQAKVVNWEGFNAKYYCEEFSIKPPNLRNWRENALAELSPSKFPKLFEHQIKKGAPTDLLKYCPNYPNLRDDQKKLIIMRILDAMVFFESTCISTARAKGPYGTAFGILQLHYGREDDYARQCRKYDSKSPKRSINCALDMLHDQIENTQRIFSSGSYWDVLRPRGQAKKAYKIASHIWYYPLCQIPKKP